MLIMRIRGTGNRWAGLLAGRLIQRVCRFGSLKPQAPECDCGPAKRCPLQTYCMAAKLERTTAARLERWFWGVVFGATISLALYVMLTSL